MFKHLALAALVAAPLAFAGFDASAQSVTSNTTVTGNQTVVGNGNFADQKFKNIGNGDIRNFRNGGSVTKDVTITGNSTVVGDYNDVRQKFKDIGNGDIKNGSPHKKHLDKLPPSHRAKVVTGAGASVQ